jgi:hypothetical protein
MAWQRQRRLQSVSHFFTSRRFSARQIATPSATFSCRAACNPGAPSTSAAAPAADETICNDSVQHFARCTIRRPQPLASTVSRISYFLSSFAAPATTVNRTGIFADALICVLDELFAHISDH